MRFSRCLMLLCWVIAGSLAHAQQDGQVLGAGLQDEVATSQSANKVYIVNQNRNDNSLQNQPATYVEASPLVESRAESIRRARRDAEVNTEVKIVEKLEASRLEDERRRADALFGDRFSQMNQNQAQTAQQPVQQAAPQQIQYIPVQTVQVAPVAPVKEEDDRAAIREEVQKELNRAKEENKLVTDAEVLSPSAQKKTYVGVGIGNLNYSQAYNVKSDIAVSVAVGTLIDESFTVEGSFTYSKAFIRDGYWFSDFPLWERMDQYNFAGAIKYNVLTIGMFKPFIGGAASYTYRQYSDASYQAREWANIGTGDSHAFDIGPAVGFDFDVSEKLSVGLDFRYMINLTSSENSKYLSSSYLYNNEELVENLNYYLFNVGAKFRF